MRSAKSGPWSVRETESRPQPIRMSGRPISFSDVAHDLHAALRLGVELAGMVLAQLFDQGAGAQGKARPDEAAVAARGAPADALALDQHDPEAAHGQQARRVQAGEASAHDRDVCRDPAVSPGRSGLASRVAAYQLAG